MNTDVIVFKNLRQRTAVVGEYSSVSVRPKVFVSQNAHGLLREVSDYEEVGQLATESGNRLKELLAFAE